MQTLLFGLFDFVAKNRWAQLVLIALLVVVTLGFYLAWRDSDVRKRERDKQAVREAKEREVLVDTVNQIEQETEDAKDRALAAPDAVSDVSSADELRERYPANAEVILRPRATGSGSGPR
jgi:cell division protein FtsB